MERSAMQGRRLHEEGVRFVAALFPRCATLHAGYQVTLSGNKF
jgi:hypothetical protein